MSTLNQIYDFIRNARTQTNALLDAIEELDALKAEWDARGMSEELLPEHFISNDIGLAPADITAVFTSLAAIKALMATGHATNLYKVK